MEQLEKSAKTEGYLTDSVSAQIETLKGMLRHDLNHDLDTHRDNIAPYLASEIVSRYYYEPGSIQQTLASGNDLDMEQAIILVRDPARYRAILAPAKE